MALRSKLFSGNQKLEAAAVSDPAHIQQGAVGEHVAKIQTALVQTDGATISADGRFGGATAAAVLSFKQKRDIINRSYQSQADSIVGKMTMAALDEEMFAIENSSQVSVENCYCQLSEQKLNPHFSVRNFSLRGSNLFKLPVR